MVWNQDQADSETMLQVILVVDDAVFVVVVVVVVGEVVVNVVGVGDGVGGDTFW